MLTAEGTIQALRQIAEPKSKSSSERRSNKRKEEGKKTRNKVEHPIALSQLQPSNSESEEGDSESDESVDGVHKIQLLSLVASTTNDQIVVVPSIINNHSHPIISDTGAAKALVNRQLAQELGLELNSQESHRHFTGLGNLQGFPTHPVNVSIGDRTHPIVFYIVDKPDLPLLIGKRDLAQFNVYVDPVTSNLIDRHTLEVVALGLETHVQQPAKQPEIDVITQKKLRATDEELFEDGKHEIFGKLKHLTPQLQQQVWELFAKYKNTWLRPRPGAVKGHKARYQYNGPAIKQRQRYLAPELEGEFRKQTSAMIESGVLEPSKSSFASVPVFAPKKDGGWRLCLDYRQVNKFIKPDRYPIPRLWDCIIKAAHHNVYCTLDINWGFWSLPLEEDSKEITAILTPSGLMQFTVAPFGIRNSPPEFQRMIDSVFDNISQVQKYIDDIVIHTYTINEMFETLGKVLQRCDECGLFLKLSKLELFQTEVSLLGFLVGINGIRPHPKKVQGIQDAKFPRSKKLLRSFLGSISFLRKFIPDLASIIAPLTHLTRKGSPFKINESHVNTFNHVKSLLTEHTLLSAPRGDGAFVVVCDASEFGLGAALLQWQEDELIILEFASKTLSKAEIKWPAYEREAYAIRWAVNRFEDYIKAGNVIVLSDHLPLQAMDKATNSKVLRWSLYLQQFDLDIRHISGNQNLLADWLSRSTPTDDIYNDEPSLDIPAFIHTELSNSISASLPVISPLFIPSVEQIINATKVAPTADLRDTYLGTDSIRYHIRTNKVYVPPALRESFIYWFHVTYMGLHIGSNRVIRRLARWVWWPKLNRDVRNYVNACLVCIRKLIPSKLTTMSGVLSRPLPLQLISFDFVGPRDWSNNKTYYYLVIIDHASRFMVTCSTDKPPTAEWLVNVFRRTWISIFAAPYAVLHDRGAEFRSSVFRGYVLDILRAHMMYTSSYYPQGNAINESSHRSLDSMLSVCGQQYNMQFADALFYVTLIQNSIPHVSTGHSPFYFLHGLEPTLPGLQYLSHESNDPFQHLDELYALRQNAVCRASLRADSNLQVVMKKVPIKVNDWVVFLLPTAKEKVKQDLINKYGKLWSLPAKVLQVRDQQLTVATWCDQIKIDVPVAKVRLLQGEIPLSLRAINLQHLEISSPTTVEPPIYNEEEDKITSMSEMLTGAQEETMSNLIRSPHKRRRTNLTVRFEKDLNK